MRAVNGSPGGSPSHASRVVHLEGEAPPEPESGAAYFAASSFAR